MRRMRHRATSEGEGVVRRPTSRAIVTLTLAALLAGLGFLVAGAVARSATQASATVSLHRTKLGAVLVNPRGRHLYLFAKDRRGRAPAMGAARGSGRRCWAEERRRRARVSGSLCSG